MLGALYVGLAGMSAYSKGLDTISNNVANLNTTGFKASVATFGDVMFRNGGATSSGTGGTRGAGVHVRTDELNFSQGENNATGRTLDAALDGNGFFVLDKDGQRFYTRAGHFDFDKDGFMIEVGSKARVMVSTSASTIGPLQIDPFRVNKPKATTEVKISGTLARTGSGTDAPADLEVAVFDTESTSHKVRVRARRDNDNPLLWTIEVVNPTDQVVGRGTLLFNADGTPAASNTAIEVTVDPDNTGPFTFKLNFGEAGTYAGTTSLVSGTNSVLQLLKQDGLKLGVAQTTQSYVFDERGNLEITYDNGEKAKVGRLVLALFDSLGDLDAVGDGMFIAREGHPPRLAGALDFGLGRMQGGKLELSNVDLSSQFTELIIIQRGYQACSQMTSVANEMMQQLLSMQGGK